MRYCHFGVSPVNYSDSDSDFGWSCVLQLLDVMEDWSNYIDNGIPFDTVYLDFAKAFDTVPHQRLIKKLSRTVSGVMF